MESFTASESNLAGTQANGLGGSLGNGSDQFVGVDVPRCGLLCPETLGPGNEGLRRVLFIHYCHFNHLEVQLSVNH